MNKEYIWSATVILMIVFLSALFFYTIGESKEFDFSITGAVGYGHAKWGSGMYAQPGGTLDKSAIIYNPSVQIKYSGWDLQPTLEFNYRWVEYNFRTLQAPIQKMEPRAWSILGGLTCDFKLLSIYGLAGITHYNANVSLIEMVSTVSPKGKIYRHVLVHGTELPFKSDLFSYKVGAYKLFYIYKACPIKVGPELSLQGWNKRPGWSRCREGRENIVQPNAGLRVQW